LRKKHEFKVPEVLKFLKDNESNLEFYTSRLTKAEIFRKLRTEWGFEENEIKEMWEKFEAYLRIKLLEEVKITEDIETIACLIKFKKRISNLLHVSIAK